MNHGQSRQRHSIRPKPGAANWDFYRSIPKPTCERFMKRSAFSRRRAIKQKLNWIPHSNPGWDKKRRWCVQSLARLISKLTLKEGIDIAVLVTYNCNQIKSEVTLYWLSISASARNSKASFLMKKRGEKFLNSYTRWSLKVSFLKKNVETDFLNIPFLWKCSPCFGMKKYDLSFRNCLEHNLWSDTTGLSTEPVWTAF